MRSNANPRGFGLSAPAGPWSHPRSDWVPRHCPGRHVRLHHVLRIDDTIEFHHSDEAKLQSRQVFPDGKMFTTRYGLLDAPLS